MTGGEGTWPSLKENLSRIEDEIETSCLRTGRSRSEVALIAVTKGHPLLAIREAAGLGIRIFGENRVQEFQQKRDELSSSGTGELLHNAQFHLIGHLQSNKAVRAVGLFSAIDTVDSLRLAERLNEAAAGLNRRLPVLLEIKLSPEESKSGLEPESNELSKLLERLPDLRSLELRGLMTVPPYDEDLERVRPYFALLRRLRGQLTTRYPKLGFAELSMGMSHDFPLAIEEGATQIRIGTALFGRRNYANQANRQ